MLDADSAASAIGCLQPSAGITQDGQYMQRVGKELQEMACDLPSAAEQTREAAAEPSALLSAAS
jgi:hypothetical protein